MAYWFAVRIRDEIIPRLVARREYRRADRLSRLAALDAHDYIVSRMGWGELVAYVRRVTGGLGDTEDEPFDVVRMGLAGSVIAWPEAVERGARVLEVGTGVGRTRYAIRVSTETSLYVTIDVDPVMLAVALFGNPVPAYREALWERDVVVLLGDAARLLRLLPDAYFDHVVHDGGPNPRRNPRLFSREVLAEIARVLRPGGTLSVFAGAEREWRTRIYRSLVGLGFEVVETVHLPGSRAAVIHARRGPCTGQCAPRGR